jgi:hypothetical protein
MGGVELIISRGGKPKASKPDALGADEGAEEEAPASDDDGGFDDAAKLLFRAIKEGNEGAFAKALRLAVESCHDEAEGY